MSTVNQVSALTGHTGVTTATGAHPVSGAQVEEELIALNNQVENLSKNISILEQRLGRVLEPEPPQDRAQTQTQTAPQVCLVPLASDIRSVRQAVGCQTQMLSDLMARLQL